MSLSRLQLGGGYAYQWECAALLALNYLVEDPKLNGPKYIGSLDLSQLINDFLGYVQAIALEGEQREEDEIELEDINLRARNKFILIQVKTKEAEGEWWTPSDSLFLKALHNFYNNSALDNVNSSVHFVFLSNRGFNPQLTNFKKAITESVDYVFEKLQCKYDSQLERERFNRLIERLTLVEFLSLDAVEDSLKNKLRALHIEDWEQACEVFYATFSKRSINGDKICLEDLYEIFPQLFTGRLIDYISTEPQRSIARKVQALVGNVTVPRFCSKSENILEKIEAILQSERNALNEIEAFILLLAVCTPYIAPRYNNSSDEMQVSSKGDVLPAYSQEYLDSFTSLDAEQLRSLIQGLRREGYFTEEEKTIVDEVVTEVVLVADAPNEFVVRSGEYADGSLRGKRIRLRLLGALLHLANKINLDQYVNPRPPITLEEMTPSERNLWWKQAYVRSVTIEDQRLQFHFGIPEDCEMCRKFLIVPLEQEIKRLVNLYDDDLKSTGLTLKVVPSEVKVRDVLSIPAEEWRRFKREIDTESARNAGDCLHRDIIRAQYHRRLLVQDEISLAEQMVQEDRHIEAAEKYACAAKLLAQAKEIAQARHYARLSAEEYLAVENREMAAEQYLQAAEIWLDNPLYPQFVDKELRMAHNIAKQLGSPGLYVRVLIAKAQLAFADLRDHDVTRFLEQAADSISQVTDKQERVNLELALLLKRSLFAMVWEDWATAEHVLTDQEQDFVGFPEQYFNLLQRILIVSIERGSWETADRVYRKSLSLLSVNPDLSYKSVLNLHRATCLARRGDLQEAYEIYVEALQELEGNVDAYVLGLAHRNMKYMLVRNGVLRFPRFSQHEIRRMDLFQITRAENLGYAHRLRATLALSEERYREAQQHIRLALYYHWKVGDWGGVESAYKTLAKLHFETQHFLEALFASIRASDSKTAEQYAKVLCDTGDVTLLTKTVCDLLKVRPAASEQAVSTKLLGVLADVIPSSYLEPVLGQLLELVQGPGNNEQDRTIRQSAAESLSSLVPQLNREQINNVVGVVIRRIKKSKYLFFVEKLFKLLDDVFIKRECQVDSSFYAPILEAMLGFGGDDYLKDKIERTMVHLARTAPPDVRSRVVDYIRKHFNSSSRLSGLAFLKEPIPERELASVIDQIMREINPKPHKIGSSMSIGFSGTSPRQINVFNEILPPSLYDNVIDGLLEVVINDHNDFHTRSNAIWSLSDLPTKVLNKRADEISDYLLWGADGTLPSSDLRIDFGSIEYVRLHSLRALGKLYYYFKTDIQDKIQTRFIQCSRDESSVVRQGVSRALDVIESDKSLPSRVLLALIVLLHDPAPLPCGWACSAAGRLIVNGLADPFVEDFLERVLGLARSAKDVEIRVGSAIALRRLARSDKLDEITGVKVSKMLEVLANDVSFRVRREATRER